MEMLKTKLGEKNYQKLIRLDNSKLNRFILKYVELCQPE